jgi:alcohol dehydrogenase class IV
VDPHYTLTCPRAVTAASGLDALTQAIESYISVKATAATRPLARQAVRLIWPALPRAVADGTDRDARAAMAEGSMLTGLAFAQSGLGAVHGFAHPIGSLLKVTHGQTCAILLPHVLRYNASAAAADLDDLAHDLGLACRNCLIAEITQMLTDFGIPHTFAPHGLQAAHFPFILKNCRSNSMSCNPVPMPDADVMAMLAKLAT